MVPYLSNFLPSCQIGERVSQGLSKVTTSPVILSGAQNLATWGRPGAEFTLSGAERLRAGPWLEPEVTMGSPRAWADYRWSESRWVAVCR